jgi:hypothetical protein
MIMFVIAACGPSGSPASGELEIDGLQRAEIRANCDYYVRCGLFESHDRCSKAFRTRDVRSLKKAVAGGYVKYDSVAAAECNAALSARSCDVTQQAGRIPEVCNRVLVGQTETNESCGFDGECTSGKCLLGGCPPGECCPGTCEPGERGPLGAACKSELECVAETFCGPDRTCIALGVQGSSCLADEQCAYGLGCAGKTDLMPGTCQPLPPIGSACVGKRCADAGAICRADNMCVAAGLTGAACTTDDDCSQFYVCGDDGKCSELPQLGDACTTRCVGDAFCSEATLTCLALTEDGEFCDFATECEGNLCLLRDGDVFAECVTAPVCF